MAKPAPSQSARTLRQSKTLGELEQNVLFALVELADTDPKESYSVGIRDVIQRRTGRRISAGALYTVLDRMEGHGFLTSEFGEPTPERGGRRKKYIRILSAGLAALDDSVRRFEGMSDGLLGRLRTLRANSDIGEP